jgi:nicotinic acid mononucleotide adenylyltransferase/nicotinamide mononucleotide (NMN) deamidase PncC
MPLQHIPPAPSKIEIMPNTLDAQIKFLQAPLALLHASSWRGVIEEVGTGSWVQTLLQTAPGASATLWSGSTAYAQDAQIQRYGLNTRAVARETAEAWARSNLHAKPQFFSLAISGVVASGATSGDHHAWLALALSDGRGWSLHLRLRQAQRLEQQFGLGVLGVNLLADLAQHNDLNPRELSLPEGLEIDFWQAWHETAFETYLRACDLLQQTSLLLFLPQSGHLQPVRPLEYLRGKKLLLHKGAFNPVTRAHLALPQAVLECVSDTLPILEISLSNADKGIANNLDLAHRLAMLAFQPWPVALTTTPALYATAELFRQAGGAERVDFVCGEDLYLRVFEPRYYQNLDGGLQEGLERLFGQSTHLWVCGRETRLSFSEQAELAARTWSEHCTQIPLDLPIASTHVRQAIAAGQSAWEGWVEGPVAEYIRQKSLYL